MENLLLGKVHQGSKYLARHSRFDTFKCMTHCLYINGFVGMTSNLRFDGKSLISQTFELMASWNLRQTYGSLPEKKALINWEQDAHLLVH